VLELEAYDRARHTLRRPTWWLLYLIGLLLVGGVGLLERVLPDGPTRTVLECGVVILAFALMLLWRHVNRARWA